MAQSDTASVPPTLLEAAKAMASLKGWSEQFTEMANLRAAIAREEAKPADYWQVHLREAEDRAQQAEASAAWHRSESERLSAELAKERGEHAKFREQVEDGSYARAIRQELQATQMIGTLDAARSLRQRAEKAEGEVSSAAVKFLAMHQRADRAEAELANAKALAGIRIDRAYDDCWRRVHPYLDASLAACPWPDVIIELAQRLKKAEAECSEQRARAESGEDRNRELSEKLIAAHGKTHAESERVKKAEAELAAVHEALKACLRPETQTGSARGDANVIAMVLQETVYQLVRAGYSAPLTVRATLPLVVDELLRLRAEAESAKGRMASAIAADLDTARDHLQAVVGAAKVACTAMSRAWGLVGTTEQPALDAAQTTLSAAAANARHMVLDRVDPKASAAGGLVDATPAEWFQAEIDRLRKANHDLQEQNWDLRTPDFPMLAEPPLHLHYAYMPGDWSSKSDEWFTYSRLMRNGHPTKMVRVGWRHGPGVSNSAPKESLNGPFQTDHSLGGTRRCGKTTATIGLAKSLAEKGHGVVVVFPSNRAAAAHAEAAKPAVTAGPGEERRQGFDVVLFDHAWYETAIADARAGLAKEKAKFADYASKVMDQDLKAAMGGKPMVSTFNGTCSFKFAEPKDAPVEPRDPLTGWTFATYRRLLQAAFPGKEGA